MDAYAEALERTVLKAEDARGGLSEKAMRELELSVREDPDAFEPEAPERALIALSGALEAIERDRDQDDLRDDGAYRMAFASRMAALGFACEEVLAIDPDCLDAQVIQVVVGNRGADASYRALGQIMEGRPVPNPSGVDLADDVFAHPWLRAMAAWARWAFESTRHRRAVAIARVSLDLSPRDVYGCRDTLALAYARLEDEKGLDELDRSFGRAGSAWIAVGRTILLYKLDRLSAARRALKGYVQLYDGGAFALARPAWVEPYLPDRPAFAPGTFEECVLAIHESEPLITDTPDFIGWCHAQPGFDEAADDFARRMGYDGA